MNKRPLCIYHGNCADGFAAAWVVWKYLDGGVDLHPGTYGAAPPDVTGREVVMVDFSYKRAVMEKLISASKSLLLLDHHKSAIADLAGLADDKYGEVFDVTRSGAMIAWDYFFSTKAPPQLLRHVQDRDLWKFELPGTEPIQNALSSYPYDMVVWDGLMASESLHRLIDDGHAITRKHHKDIKELLGVTKRRMIIGGHDVPVANLPYTMSSDAGHIMTVGEKFAACYADTPTGRVFSLRSAPDGLDVSTIAMGYGGGGHKNASGFTRPIGWEGDVA